MKNRETAFMGKITAGITHEFKNVLAIIKESSGLMGDLLELCDGDTFAYRDKFINALSTIQGQLTRGVELAIRLNRFAHSTDEAKATVDLNEAVDLIVSLCERFARLVGVKIEVKPNDRTLSIVTNPLQLQMVLYSCLECCWEQMPNGGAVTVGPALHGGACAIVFGCQGGPDDAAAWARALSESQSWATLQDLSRALEGKIETGGSAPGFLLALPMR
jgi:hypothetical protein